MAAIYGVHSLTDFLDQRVSDVQPALIQNALALAQAAHEQDLNDSLSIFVKRVTTHNIGVQVTSDNELQDVDEWGRPDPVRFQPPIARYFPLRMAQTAIAYNWVTGKKMTVQELNDRLEQMFAADTSKVRNWLFKSLFNNTSYAYVDPQFGSISISPLANGDSETYRRTGTGTTSADTHHKGSAALDNAVFTDMRDELAEHDENGGDNAQVVAFVPTASRATVLALTDVVPAADPNVTLGTGVSQYTGSFADTAPGTPIAYHEGGKVHIREWPRLPDNYVVGTTDAAIKPIAMREDEEADMRGFKEVYQREDQPYHERIWSRRAGFGAYNRVGAVIYRTNNSSYAIPTGYTAP